MTKTIEQMTDLDLVRRSLDRRAAAEAERAQHELIRISQEAQRLANMIATGRMPSAPSVSSLSKQLADVSGWCATYAEIESLRQEF